MFKSFITRLRVVLRWGVHEDISGQESRRVVLANAMALTAALLIVPYVIIFFYVGHTSIALSILVLDGCYWITPLLNRWRRYLAARFMLIIVPCASLIVYGMAFGPKLQLHMVSYAFVAWCFLVFTWRQLPALIASVTLTVATHVALQWFIYPRGPLVILNEAFLAGVGKTIDVAGHVLLIAAVSYLFLDYERTESRLVDALDKLWAEMGLAKKIQTVLLPKNTSTAEYEIESRMAPADEVGGDHYDVVTINGSRWISIGDVSGHGVTSGLIAMIVHTALTATLKARQRHSNVEAKPSEVIVEINDAVASYFERIKQNAYMTLMLLRIDAKHQVTYAGLHQDILVYRAQTRQCEVFPTTGAWIGLRKDLSGLIADNTFSLNPGDRMLLYTDGVTEARRGTEMFGFERLRTRFFALCEAGTSSSGIVESLFAELEAYRLIDDVTLMVVSRVEG